VKTLLQCLADQYRWVVLDVPHGDVSLLEALEPMTALTLVVTQDVPAVRLATRLTRRLLQQFNRNKLGIVINRFDSGLDIGSEDVQKAVGLSLLSLVPADTKRAIAAANAGKPVVADSGSRITPAIKQLAAKFTATVKPETKTAPGSKIVRLAGLF
jgi:Flp pilus assembly CpaE family ATPase